MRQTSGKFKLCIKCGASFDIPDEAALAMANALFTSCLGTQPEPMYIAHIECYLAEQMLTNPASVLPGGTSSGDTRFSTASGFLKRCIGREKPPAHAWYLSGKLAILYRQAEHYLKHFKSDIFNPALQSVIVEPLYTELDVTALSSLYDQEGSFQSFKKAALQGHPDAQYEMGLFEFDKYHAAGLTDHCGLSDDEMLKAVIQNHEFEKRNQFNDGVANGWLKDAANRGHVKAQLEVGNRIVNAPVEYLGAALKKGRHERGSETEAYASDSYGAELPPWDPDYAEAVLWWRKAASQGSVEAKLKLAGSYFRGVAGTNGIDKNYAEAFKLYTEIDSRYMQLLRRVSHAAIQEHEEVLRSSSYNVKENLAFMLRDGVDGVAQDAERALDCYTFLGVVRCSVGREGLWYMKTKGSLKARQAADRYWEMAAAPTGSADSQIIIGDLYAIGVGLSYSGTEEQKSRSDQNEAIKWYAKASMQGFPAASGKLAEQLSWKYDAENGLRHYDGSGAMVFPYVQTNDPETKQMIRKLNEHSAK